MKRLSMDLRARIVSAYEGGEGSYVVLATRFSVSRSVVGKLVRQSRTMGTLHSQVHRRGRKRTITGEKEQQLHNTWKNILTQPSKNALTLSIWIAVASRATIGAPF